LSRRAIRFNEVVNAPQPIPRALQHPFFSWAGLRPVLAQHTAAEHQALQRHARQRQRLVEIGVAEGASAMALRDGMDPQGHLYLIDPYQLSRVPALNFLRRAARRAVSSGSQPKIFWIQEFSHQAIRSWTAPICSSTATTPKRRCNAIGRTGTPTSLPAASWPFTTPACFPQDGRHRIKAQSNL
jgi:hypothetical protein